MQQLQREEFKNWIANPPLQVLRFNQAPLKGVTVLMGGQDRIPGRRN